MNEKYRSRLKNKTLDIYLEEKKLNSEKAGKKGVKCPKQKLKNT